MKFSFDRILYYYVILYNTELIYKSILEKKQSNNCMCTQVKYRSKQKSKYHLRSTVNEKKYKIPDLTSEAGQTHARLSRFRTFYKIWQKRKSFKKIILPKPTQFIKVASLKNHFKVIYGSFHANSIRPWHPWSWICLIIFHS
jgi:hypothetical protein